MWSFLDIFFVAQFFSSLFDRLGRWGLVFGLLDDLVDLTSKEEIDTVTDWWTQWVSSTGVEHIEDDLDVLIKVVGVLHTLVGCSTLALVELALLVLAAESLLGKTEETGTHLAGFTATSSECTADG